MLFLQLLALTSTLVSATRHNDKRNHLLKRDLLANVQYLQNVVTFQICILASSSLQAAALIGGKSSTVAACIPPINPANLPVATPAQLAAISTTTSKTSTTLVHHAPSSTITTPSVLTSLPISVTPSIGSAIITGTATISVYATGTAIPITPSVGPHFLLYADSWTNYGAPPAPSQIQGWTVFALAFWLASGPADMAQGWALLSQTQRTNIKAQYASAGIKLITAAFGSTETPTTSGYDPIDTADRLATFVKTYNLDGVDVDYEDFAAMENNASPGIAENWLIAFTTQLRYRLPSPQYIITHAPIAPWLTYNTNWGGGGYLYINSQVGQYIDWYNVQFYEQGLTEYTNCTTLLYTSSIWPESSLFQIAANGVPLDKLLIGKPAIASDASSGFIPTKNLAACVKEAQQQGYQGGLSAWQYNPNLVNYVPNIWGPT